MRAMSTIVEVELVEFDHEVVYRYSGSGRPLAGTGARTRTTRRFGIRIRTRDGVEGAYVVLWSAPPHAVSQVKAMASGLLGLDLFERERIWDANNNTFAKTDRIGAGAVDIALWDAAGKATGLPVSALLGSYRTRLPVYASTVNGGLGLGSLADPASYQDFAATCAGAGLPAFKVHAPPTGSVRDEIDCLLAAAEGAAGRMAVMTDPTKSLRTLTDALALGRVCDDIGAYWWEDPMRDNAPFGHRILRERIRTPLLLTELVRGLDMRMAVALAGGTDILRADPELDMGITGVMKSAHAAESIGLDLELHASGPAQRHCMAAIRNSNFYELGLLDPETGNTLHPPVYLDDDYTEDLSAVGTDGCVAVPTGPGLGVTYDWDRIYAQRSDRTLFRAKG